MTVAAAAVAAHGLPTEHRFPDDVLTEGDAAQLLTAAVSDRVLGFLAAAVRDGALRLRPEDRAQVEQRWEAWLSHTLRIERLLLRALTQLQEAGIDARVLKGVALAHTAYPDPALRVFGDVDLLLPSRDFSRGAEVLARTLGASRAVPELRPGFDDQFGKEATLRLGSLELDLHRVFVEGAFGLTIDLDDLFAPPYRFALGIYELEALPMPQRLLHASYAAALGDWPARLVSLRDVAELVLRERPHLVDVLLMAKRWRCEVVVARAVTTTWRELRLTTRLPIVEWAERYVPSRTDRMLLASHQGPARAFTRHVAAIAVLPGFSERLQYARAIAFPQASYLRARGMSSSSHAARAMRRILG